MDYRDLNSVTKRNAHPIPRTDDIVHKLGTTKYYTSVDMMFKGFWQVSIHGPDIKKTAFITPWGLYEWLNMPMGLMNSGATFQAMMEEALCSGNVLLFT